MHHTKHAAALKDALSNKNVVELLNDGSLMNDGI